MKCGGMERRGRGQGRKKEDGGSVQCQTAHAIMSTLPD